MVENYGTTVEKCAESVSTHIKRFWHESKIAMMRNGIHGITLFV